VRRDLIQREKIEEPRRKDATRKVERSRKQEQAAGAGGGRQ
jgi:hypothetical protein